MQVLMEIEELLGIVMGLKRPEGSSLLWNWARRVERKLAEEKTAGEY